MMIKDKVIIEDRNHHLMEDLINIEENLLEAQKITHQTIQKIALINTQESILHAKIEEMNYLTQESSSQDIEVIKIIGMV